MISSIRLDGTTASMSIAGAADGVVFGAYVERVLCPTLRKGDIVVMDNLAVHKRPATLALIESAGAQVRFLAAYCLRRSPVPPTSIPSKRCGVKSKHYCAPPRHEPPSNSTEPSAMRWQKSPEMMPEVGSLRAAIVLFNML